MRVTVESAGSTDIGRVRKNNEDHFLIADLVKQLRVTQTSLLPSEDGGWKSGVTGHLFVVADGMGGMSGGEVASGLAVETISWYVAKTMPWFYRYQDGREVELEHELRKAVQVTQDTVKDAAEHSRFRRMGTTLTLACLLWPRLYVVHAGDSRCYIRRGDTLTRLTTDHTLAQRAVDEGVLTASQAEAAGLGHALWNCIGAGQKEVTPELHHTTLQAGDELLLCTDGLTRRLTDEELLTILKRSGSPALAVKALIEAANEAGGQDNITAIIARTNQVDDPNATKAHAVALSRTV
ncbi:protein phosphatase 2C domain-containing protein [Gemmata sp. JC717]|uniref:PP2C family protein-serine/threonine phosphatase n=1 Tax=Gemmata algarum TaxID=2975278 RepID=UPI0021BA45F2|nr:protein phosphatase 2C domain-containing protein [Gemmata algarum]MDY3552120.1 protein phosphatase 2C domain-containing protein [Gemmata algarum]